MGQKYYTGPSRDQETTTSSIGKASGGSKGGMKVGGLKDP